MKQHKTEEKLKDDIFNAYSRYLNALSSDRRQTYFGQLCDPIFRWCDTYLFNEAKEMGIEIVSAVDRLVNKENKNIQKDKNQFIKYLRRTLRNARNEYYRNNKQKTIKFPRIIYEIEKIIQKHEIDAGRNLSNEEKIQFVSRFYNKTREKTLIYLKAINAKNIGKLDYSDDGKKHNILDTSDVKPAYMNTSLDEPEDTMLLKYDLTVIQKAVNSVLEKSQKRTRPLYKALFTVNCIKFNNFEGLLPVLDSEILETYYKTEKKPKQYEVYMKYRPKAKKASAEVLAHETIKKFLKKLKSKLAEKKH